MAEYPGLGILIDRGDRDVHQQHGKGHRIRIAAPGADRQDQRTDGGTVERVKVDTTPHDHTVAWTNCLREGASKFGFATLRDFLEQVDAFLLIEAADQGDNRYFMSDIETKLFLQQAFTGAFTI